MTPVAALFVDERGPYVGLPGVEVWGISRDARTYQGPHPVVAHPPCERWGRYATGGPSARVRREVGDDAGCYASALASVRRWGGVLEHPAHSLAWTWYELQDPPHEGGWVHADSVGGWTCRVDQGVYGHRARKATWLYAHAGVGRRAARTLPDIRWERAPHEKRGGVHTVTGRQRGGVELMSHRQRRITPVPFRDLLLGIARGLS